VLKFFSLADESTQYVSVPIYVSLLTEQTVSVVLQSSMCVSWPKYTHTYITVLCIILKLTFP